METVFTLRALSELRVLKQEGASPDILAATLAGEDTPSAHVFRRELIAAGACVNALGRGLRGCDSYEAHVLRCEIAPKILGMRPPSQMPELRASLPDERSDGKDRRNVLAWSLNNCRSEAARIFREILLDAGALPKAIAWSLSGCEDNWSFKLREKLLAQGTDPAFVTNGLRGCDGEKAWRLRDRFMLTQVRRDWIVRGTTGCKSSRAFALWQEVVDEVPKDIAISLVGRDGDMNHVLRWHILKKNPNHWPEILMGLAGCDSPDAWKFRHHPEAQTHPVALAFGLAGCTSEHAFDLRKRLRTSGTSVAAIAASYFGNGEYLTWYWQRRTT